MISRFMESRLGDTSPIREAYERAEGLKAKFGVSEVFDFSIGNPTAPCPAGVEHALAETARRSGPQLHGYMQESGYAEVRRAVAESLNRRFGSAYSPDHIVMTAGAACALSILFRTILDAGDEVVTFAPCYPAYHLFVGNCGAKLVLAPYDPETLLPDLDAFAALLSSKTKAVLVNTPHNPTGLVYSAELAQQLVGVIEAYTQKTGQEIMLVSDEPYRELAFEGTVAPWWPALYSNTTVVYSWSKSASIAGERIGYLALPPSSAEVDLLRRGACRSLGELGFVNAPATAQRMAAACVDDTVDVSYYDRNRQALLEGLRSCGLSPLHGNGAFYLLLPAPDGDEDRFVARLADERIVVVGGSAFGCPGYVRLSYCVSAETIEAALPHFAQVAALYATPERMSE